MAPVAPRNESVAAPVDAWVRLEILIPRTWKAWLVEASQARAMTVSDLVRQCIRGLMIERHRADDGGT